MRTYRYGPDTFHVVVNHTELDDLVSDIGATHHEFCISSDNCTCSARIAALMPNLPPPNWRPHRRIQIRSHR